MIDSAHYYGYHNLTNRTVEVGGNLSVSKPEDGCLQVSFPSTSSVQFCEKKEMMSFVVTLGDILKNTTRGLLGTWNDNLDDDFKLPDGTVLSSSSSLKEIHYGFGVKCKYNIIMKRIKRLRSKNVNGIDSKSYAVSRINTCLLALTVCLRCRVAHDLHMLLCCCSRHK